MEKVRSRIFHGIVDNTFAIIFLIFWLSTAIPKEDMRGNATTEDPRISPSYSSMEIPFGSNVGNEFNTYH